MKEALLGTNHGKADLFTWMEIFMFEYGMSFEEFKTLPIPTFYKLKEKLIERKKREGKKNKR